MNNTLKNVTLYELEPLILSMASPTVSCIGIINFCLGLPLYIYTTIVLIRAGGLDRSVIFGLNQCLSEIFFALPAPLPVLCCVSMRNICFVKPMVFFTAVCLTARFMFQCFVCFDRYLAVVHPLLFLKYKSMKYRIVNSVLIWMYSLFIGFFNTNYFLSLPFDVYGFLYIIILSMHLFFCLSILRVLRKPGPGERERANGGVNVIKKKAFEFVSFNLMIFLVQTIPVTAAFGIEKMLSMDAFSLAFNISMTINIAAGIVQPILILHKMGKLTFRSHVLMQT